VDGKSGRVDAGRVAAVECCLMGRIKASSKTSLSDGMESQLKVTMALSATGDSLSAEIQARLTILLVSERART
jgi:hypothetical protein